MSALIRKVWDSVAHRPASSSAAASKSTPNPASDYDRFLQIMYFQTSSTGDFDRIPIDIFMQILKILGPRESARLRAVCKSWKFLASDNRLWIYFLQHRPEPWDFVFFAETHLRSGYPLQDDGGDDFVAFLLLMQIKGDPKSIMRYQRNKPKKLVDFQPKVSADGSTLKLKLLLLAMNQPMSHIWF